MIILHWNCQGLRNPLTIRHLKESVSKYRPELILLSETKNGVDIVDKVRQQLGFEDKFLVPPNGLGGGLAVLWRHFVGVDILKADCNKILLNVNIMQGNLLIAYIYGPPNRKLREKFWQILGPQLRSIQSQLLLLGDSGLIDLYTKGGEYTWIGKRYNHVIRAKLDRVMEFLQACLEEERDWRLKSRALWLQAGDKNTAYFHARVKKRANQNKIMALKDDSGVQHTSKRDLTRNISEEEVRKAVFEMHPEKTPGPDGLSPAFFQHHWQSVKSGYQKDC